LCAGHGFVYETHYPSPQSQIPQEYGIPGPPPCFHFPIAFVQIIHSDERVSLLTKDFDYHLPAELIAAHPLADRAASRMMVIHRQTGNIEHRMFRDFLSYLQHGDMLVLNDTKVIPARVFPTMEKSNCCASIIPPHCCGSAWSSLGKKCALATPFR
jgi:hypothetical protein